MPVQNWVSPGQVPDCRGQTWWWPRYRDSDTRGRDAPQRDVLPQGVPDTAPAILAWGRAGCSAHGWVAGPHAWLAGPHGGWQVPHRIAGRFLQWVVGSPVVGGRSPIIGRQVPTEGGRSPAAGWQVQRGGCQVLMAFPNPTSGVLVQFAGTWHVAAAASNCSVFLKMKDGMKSSITTISFTPEGDLAMKLVWPL